jgi:hypothetical protein
MRQNPSLQPSPISPLRRIHVSSYFYKDVFFVRHFKPSSFSTHNSAIQPRKYQAKQITHPDLSVMGRHLPPIYKVSDSLVYERGNNAGYSMRDAYSICASPLIVQFCTIDLPIPMECARKTRCFMLPGMARCNILKFTVNLGPFPPI